MRRAGSRASHWPATANKWIVGEVARTREAVDEALGAFRFNDAANTLYAFTYTYCDWYLEFSKPLFDTEARGRDAQGHGLGTGSASGPAAPDHAVSSPRKLWGLSARREKMLIHADWPTYGAELVDEAAVAEMRWVRDLIEKVRSVRGEMNVPKSLKAQLLKLSLDPDGEAAWARNEAIILRDREAGIDSLTEADAAPKGAATIAVEGGTFALPLEGLIDVAAERSRLEKSVGKLEKETERASRPPEESEIPRERRRRGHRGNRGAGRPEGRGTDPAADSAGSAGRTGLRRVAVAR